MMSDARSNQPNEVIFMTFHEYQRLAVDILETEHRPYMRLFASMILDGRIPEDRGVVSNDFQRLDEAPSDYASRAAGNDRGRKIREDAEEHQKARQEGSQIAGES